MSADTPIDHQKNEIEAYHKLEIDEIFERTRQMIAMRMQTGAFLGTASLTILGIGFTQKLAGLCFIAGGFLLVYLALDIISGTYSKPLYERGVKLEEKYASDPEDAILHKRAHSYKEKKGNSYRAYTVRISLFFVSNSHR